MMHGQQNVKFCNALLCVSTVIFSNLQGAQIYNKRHIYSFSTQLSQLLTVKYMIIPENNRKL